MSGVIEAVAAALASAALPALAAAALLGGLIRGFTGFGFAMVFMPIAGLVLPLPVAVAVIFALDAPFSLPLAAPSLRKAEWREVAPLLGAATVSLPVGVWLLVRIDPYLLRWLIAVVVAVAVAALVTGWRWRGRPGLPLSLGVGSMSGLASGLTSLGGLPLALFWLSAQAKSAAQMRHDLMTYFACATVVSGAILHASGLMTVQAVGIALALMPLYGVGILAGTLAYRRVSEAIFRKLAYGLIAAIAFVSLPLWDGLIPR